MVFSATDIIFFIFVFFGIYIQVFFLVAFISKRKELRNTPRFKPGDSYPSVTFLVPCWNEGETIKEAIDALLGVDYPHDRLYVIAVDDGSTDNSWDIMQKYADNPRVKIYKKENGGKHTAVNYALDKANTEYVVVLDADTRLAKNAMTEIMAFFVRDPELAAVAGTVVIHKPDTIVRKAQSVEYHMFAYNKKTLGMLDGVLVAPGAFSVYKTDIFKKVGGLYRAHNLEDLELTFRLQTLGYKVNHSHTARAYTTGPASLKALFKQRLRWSRGFLMNVFDYKKIILNKRFGNFGVFTVPTSILSYLVILYVFIMMWVTFFQVLIERIARFKIAGWESFRPDFFTDPFFVNTHPLFFLTILMYLLIILSVVIGVGMTKGERFRIRNFVYFMIVYSLVLPFWIVTSMYKIITRKQLSW